MKRAILKTSVYALLCVYSLNIIADANDILMPTIMGTAIGGAAGGGKGAAIGAGVGLGTGLMMSAARDGGSRRSTKKLMRQRRELENRRDDIKEELKSSDLTPAERKDLKQELREVNRDIRDINQRLQQY